LLFLLVSVAMSNLSIAQLSQPRRFEREHKSRDVDYTVVAMGEQGIALIRDKEKYERGEKFWELILVDTTLAEIATKEIPIDNRYRLIGHDYRDGMVYILFRMGETDQGDLKIIKIDPMLQQTTEYNYKPELMIQLTHFNIVANQFMFAGYVSNQPTVLLYNMENNQAKLVPGLIVTNAELLDVRANINNTFNVLLSERQSKAKKNLILKTFDHTGALLLDDVITVDPERTILSGTTSMLVRDELIIIGTWGEGVLKQSAGLFTVLVDPYNEQKINFFDFGQLIHFFDYMTPKRAAKTKMKSDNKRMAGKIPEFKTNVLPIRLEETKEGFLFYSEAYYSSTNLSNNRWNNTNPATNYPYSPYGFGNPWRVASPYNYGYPYNNSNSTSSAETKMQLASIAVFDSKGLLINDHGFKLEDLKLNSAEQVADFVYTPSRTTIAFSKEENIHIQVSQIDGVPLINEKELQQLNHPSETVRAKNENEGNVRYWYKNNLFLFGYQTIKNPEKGNRDVFFINKLKVD
jgi:hypothetical protein